MSSGLPEFKILRESCRDKVALTFRNHPRGLRFSALQCGHVHKTWVLHISLNGRNRMVTRFSLSAYIFTPNIHAIFIVYTPFMHENSAEPREFSKAVRSERFSGSGNGKKQSAKFSLLLYTLFSRLF